jgi:hypothetical protein
VVLSIGVSIIVPVVVVVLVVVVMVDIVPQAPSLLLLILR